MKKKFMSFINFFSFCVLITFNFAFAQVTSYILDGKVYVYEKNTWYLTDGETSAKYEVNKRSLTVKLNESASREEFENLTELLGIEIKRENILGFIDLILPENVDFFEIYNEYKNSGLVKNIDINAYGKSLLDPNDYYYQLGYQYYLNHDSRPDINAPEGWGLLESAGSFGAGVIIAIIDDGTDNDHPDLRFWEGWGWDFIDGDATPEPTGHHGTHVSGISAAKTNNVIGIAGIAGGWGSGQEAQIMSLKVMTPGYINSDVVDDAIIFAALNGAKIINMSFETPDLSAIRSALDFAYNNRECLLIAAGGNEYNESIPFFPARDPNVMAVAGIQLNWNHYGNKGYELEITAPAQDIYSTYNNSGYGYFSGTSQAAPQVSGAAALMWSNVPDLINFDIRRILKITADQDFSSYNPLYFGEGLLKIDNAINYLIDFPDKPTNVTIYAPIGGHPTINWSSVTGADSYNVYRSTPNQRLDLYAATNTTNTSWTDNFVTVSNPKTAQYTYYYRVTAVDGNYESAVSNEVWCGSNSIWKQNIYDNENIENDYELFNNYPNPFNPTTLIKYSLKKEELVSIAVYNILGQRVDELINEVKPEGIHEVIFNSSNLPSGIYFYSIRTQNFTDTKKMILLR